MTTETLFDLLKEEKELLEEKHRLEFNIMCNRHGLEQAECYPEYSRFDADYFHQHLEVEYKHLIDIGQRIPEVQVKIKDAIKAYDNAEFVSGVVSNAQSI